MYTHILLRYGEIFLKGKNQYNFLRSLKNNIEIITAQKSVKIIQGRFLMPYFNTHSHLCSVFGLISYSPALRVEKDPIFIINAIIDLLKNKTGTFRIDTKRSDKRFTHSSLDFNKIVGEEIEAKTSLRFSFSDPQIIQHIEINEDGAYLFTEIVPCHGGLPTGVEGRVGLIVENENSILAGLLFMKRGCDVFPIILQESVSTDLLQKYSPRKLYFNVICDPSKIDSFVQEHHLQALVDGATMETLTPSLFSTIVFHPLIHYTIKEIKCELESFR